MVPVLSSTTVSTRPAIAMRGGNKHEMPLLDKPRMALKWPKPIATPTIGLYRGTKMKRDLCKMSVMVMSCHFNKKYIMTPTATRLATNNPLVHAANRENCCNWPSAGSVWHWRMRLAIIVAPPVLRTMASAQPSS